MKKNIIVSMFVLVILMISVGFSCTGSSVVVKKGVLSSSNNWSIKFENCRIIDTNVDKDLKLHLDDEASMSFDALLDIPGDYYEFVVDIANRGNLDAVVEDFNITKLTKDEARILDYKVTYLDGSQIKKSDTLKAGEVKSLKVRIEFKYDITEEDLEYSGRNVKLNVSLNYVQDIKDSKNI